MIRRRQPRAVPATTQDIADAAEYDEVKAASCSSAGSSDRSDVAEGTIRDLLVHGEADERMAQAEPGLLRRERSPGTPTAPTPVRLYDDGTPST